jgi:Fic family protein
MAEDSGRIIRSSKEAHLKTHPWIKFALHTKEPLPARLWLALGEARSKVQHLSGVPLKPGVAQMLHELSLAKGVHATTAIEGNTLTEAQVLSRVQGEKSSLPQSQQYLQTEIDNVLSVANDIIDHCEGNDSKPITTDDIRSYNERILRGLEVDDHVVPGRYRDMTVGVNDYRAPDAHECEYLMERLCEWLNGPDFHPKEADAIVNGILKAVIAHVYLAWIHPFGDGNGRTARMLEVRILMEAGIPSPAVHLLSDHYNKTRGDYYRRLSEASKNGGDLANFLIYAVNGFLDLLREQLLSVRSHQWQVAWQNYLYEIFGQNKTIAQKRQIALLLALPASSPLPVAKIRRLTPELAEAYAERTAKTLSRDLNQLAEMELIERTKEGVRARIEIILAFLPRMRRGELGQYIHGMLEPDLSKRIAADLDEARRQAAKPKSRPRRPARPHH